MATVEQLYGYDPVMGLAYAAAVVFLLLAAALLFVNLKFPPNRFMHVLVFAALGEVAGFAIRIVSVHNTTLLTFIATTLFLLLMPNFIALVNYMAVGRLMAFSDLSVGFLKPRWLAKIFFFSDLCSFLIQGMGGGLLASDNQQSQDLGKSIIIIGLALQSLFLFLFLFVTVSIHVRPRHMLTGLPDARRMFIGLYVTTALLFIRSIFRLVEYASGRDAYLTTHEWPFYVFDALAMAAAFVVYALPPVHYGRCLNALREQLGDPASASSTTELPVSDSAQKLVRPVPGSASGGVSTGGLAVTVVAGDARSKVVPEVSQSSASAPAAR